MNLSGHSDTAYHPPVEMRDIGIELRGKWRSAHAVGLDRGSPASPSGRSTKFVLPVLKGYEVVVLE